MVWVRKILILTHRYVGIVLSLLFVIWFLSGIGMMYARGNMPGLTPEFRFLRLPAIDFSKIRLSPAEAVARVEAPPEQAAPQQASPTPTPSEPARTPAAQGSRNTPAPPSGETRGRGTAVEGQRRGGGRTEARGQRQGSGQRQGRGQPQGQTGGQVSGAAGQQAAATPAGQPENAANGRGGGRGGGGVGRVVVGTFLDRPVYRLSGGRGGGSIVFADDGTVMTDVNADTAKKIVAQFLNLSEDKLHYSLQTEIDQWTIGQRRQLPLHKITVDDSDHSVLYLSPKTGDIAVLTTRGTRALAWVAAIPHWLYFTPLRVQDRLWTRVILWTSGIGSFLAVIGIILGFTQFKWSRSIQLSNISSHIPYSGLMRWHYITGIAFGVLTLTWVFSGLLSMDPWEWVSGRDLRIDRGQFTGGGVDIREYPKFDAAAWSQLVPGHQIKEIEFAKIQGDPYYVAHDADSKRLLINANPLRVRTEPFDTDDLVDRLKKAVPDAHMLESELLTKYDSYYYDRQEERPLPILRAKFDDPKETWVYVDPTMGQVAGQLHRGDRIQRWLYKGFHSLDFSFWYYSPVWDAGMIFLNLGGAVMSGFGLWVGFRRLGRGIKRTAKSLSSRRASREVVGGTVGRSR